MKDQVTIIDLKINILKHDSTKKRVELLLNVSGLQAALNVPTMGNRQVQNCGTILGKHFAKMLTHFSERILTLEVRSKKSYHFYCTRYILNSYFVIYFLSFAFPTVNLHCLFSKSSVTAPNVL